MKFWVYLLILGLALVLPCQSVNAQNTIKYAVQIKHDKKIIHPELMNLPDGTSALSLLNLLPELLDKNFEECFNKYEIKIEDVSVEESKDLILTNLRIEDIKEIEISESPVTSFEKNGQGGSINIILKDVNEKASGYVSANYSNFNYLTPTAFFGIKRKKLSIKAIAAYEYYDPKEKNAFITFYDGETSSKKTSDYVETTDFLSNTQMARVYLRYDPTENDILKFCLSDNYTKSDGSLSSDPKYTILENNDILKKLNLRANSKYEHIFRDQSKLVVEANYNYLPSRNDVTVYDFLEFNSDSRKHNLGGNVEYSLNIYRSEAKAHTIKLLTGSDYNISNLSSTSYQSNEHFPAYSNINSNTYFVAPFLKLDCQFGKFFLKSIFEYQIYNYSVSSANNCSHTFQNNLTGKLAVGWQFNPHHYIRLVYDKKLKRPLDEQIFPYFVYSPTLGTYVVGNTDLRPMTSNEVKLEYISDITTKNNTSIILNASVNYIRTDDVIQEVTMSSFPYDYLTFNNDGNKDILCNSLMFYLRKNIFSFSVTGNLYFDRQYYSGNKDYSTYYILSCQSSLNFKSGWMGTINLVYSSSIESASMSIGDVPYGRLSVGKAWKHFQINAFCTTDLSGRQTDISYSTKQIRYKTYYSTTPTIGLSGKFKF